MNRLAATASAEERPGKTGSVDVSVTALTLGFARWSGCLRITGSPLA